MRRTTGISVAAHGLLIAALLAGGLAKPPPPPAAPPALTVALATLPARKPVPPPQAEPVRQPPPQAKPRPQPAKAPLRPDTTGPATLAAAPVVPQPAAPAPAEPPPPAAPPATAPASADEAWLAEMRARLETAKRYPPAARRLSQEGVAVVTFEVGRDGTVLSRSLASGSGSPHLDREALELPGRISPLPPMPEGMAQARLTVTVPVRFSLR